MPEEQLADIEGKYLKLKFKNPTPARHPGPLDYTTPIDETLLGQDSTDADSLVFDDSMKMREQMEKLNEQWHVFVILMIVFAMIAFFIHRHLK